MIFLPQYLHITSVTFLNHAVNKSESCGIGMSDAYNNKYK